MIIRNEEELFTLWKNAGWSPERRLEECSARYNLLPETREELLHIIHYAKTQGK